ncbi:MAG: L-threonylcarbamoyladenylate synthase [Salibacteraceae bacterium]|nr:L-threonylcarbamoyladenylate synthase [Salibacteraceae bacterium]|tara:strand:+ start:16837 stop:17406 length:570 start_codon:yes stop_codon:yes gene_type:complete
MDIKEEIRTTITTLKEGKVILYPTDTILGLGCDATQQEACDKIVKIKQSSTSKSFVCLVSSDAMLNKVIKDVPEIAWDLFDEAAEPLTLILPNAIGLAKGVAAEDGTAAFRMIKEGPLHRIIHQFGKPIVSTSVNISGNAPALTLEEVDQEIKEQVDYIVSQNGFPKGTKKPSSIIKVGLGSEIKIIRQ